MQNCNTNVAWRSGPSVRWIKASINCEPDEKVPKKCGDVWILKIKHGVYDYKFSFECYRISYFLIRYIFGSTYAIKSWETQEKQVIDLKILYIYTWAVGTMLKESLWKCRICLAISRTAVEPPESTDPDINIVRTPPIKIKESAKSVHNNLDFPRSM